MKYALQLRNAMLTNNDTKFFKLYESAPHMSGYLIDYMLFSVRKSVYDVILSSYDTVSIQFMMKKLHFSEVNECKEFLDKRNVKYNDGNKVSSTTTTSESMKNKQQKKKKKKKEKVKVKNEVNRDPSTLTINCRSSRISA